MEENSYKPRIADKMLDFKLHSKGAVVIQGPKWVGKTTSARRVAKSVIEFGGGQNQEQNVALAKIDIDSVIQGPTPRLFDEWQEVSALWDAIRYEVDHRNAVGQFILTGSTVKFPKDSAEDPRRHTGTGRYSYLFMRPMSLMESGESNNEISLAGLFDNPDKIFSQNRMTLQDIAFVTCRGGWPFAVSLEGDYALAQAKDYYDAIVNDDISRVDGKRRDVRIVKKLLRSYARNQAQNVSIESIANDVGEVDSRTVADYLNALQRLYVVEDVEAWNPNIRSRVAIRTSDTRYFVDPSIATASLGLKPDGLIGDLKTFGFIFETLAMRDLRVYADSIGGTIYHYRDKNGLECDAAIVLEDGRYGLIEIKLGHDAAILDEAAKKLSELEAIIDTDKMGMPSFKMILCSSAPYAYKRDDGVYIVPIGCLGA